MNYTAETLDLSRLPAFTLAPVTYEGIRAARMESLKLRLAARGVDYDVETLETDPLAILEQEDAYREFLTYQALNDAGRGLSLAYAVGAQLDHIAATYYADLGLRRLDGEDDERFRRRIMLAPEARSAGTLGGYEFLALGASLDVKDARALNYASGVVRPGQIAVVVAGAPGSPDWAPIVEAVRAVVLDPNLKAASDDVRVIQAAVTPYNVTAALRIKRGPDAGLVVAQAVERLNAYAADRRRVAEVVRGRGITAALMAPAVEDIVGTFADINPGPTGIAELGDVSLSVESVDG